MDLRIMIQAEVLLGVTKPQVWPAKMKWRKWLVLFLLAFATPAFAQSVQSASTTCSWRTSCTVPFSNSVSAGDAIAVAVKVSSWGTGAKTPVLTDSQRNPYTVVSSEDASPALYQVFVFCTPKTAAGADSITSTLPVANVQDLVILEFQGTCTVAQSTVAKGTSTSAATPSISVPSGDFLFGVATSKYYDTFKPSAGFIKDTSLGDIAVAHSSQSAAGSAAVTFTLGGSTTWTALLVAFSPAQSTAPLTVAIASPANGGTVSGTITSSGTASASGSVSSVQVAVDNGSFSNASGTNNWSFPLNTASLSNATHTIKAKATDSSGNTAISNPVSITVNNGGSTSTPLAVAIASPASGATVSGIITSSGTASASGSVSSVQVAVDNGSFSNASGTNNWSFSLNTASLSNATHTLTAKATDSSGNTATSNPVSITVNNAAGPTATINWTDVHQQIDGFGASSAFTGDGITNSQADLFWSTTTGIGLSLLRVQVQTNGTYPDLATMQKAQDRGVTIWATPWSPPASMKTNGSIDNGGSLLASSYQAYADYLANYVLTLKNSYGINLYALSIQNEPNYTASYASCIWTGQQFHDFILNNLTPTFAKDGVGVKIIMPEESGWSFDLATATLNDPAAAAGVNIIAAHNYDGSGASAYALGQNQGKHLWETEVSTFDSFDSSMANGLFWAQKIQDWMTIASANAWHYWWLLDSGGDNQALLGTSGQTTKRLYVMGNFSKFVRPGYVRIGATASPVSGVSISAYKNPSSGQFAIVAINHNASAVALNFALNGFTAGSVTPWVTSSSLDLAQQPSISVGGSAFTATLPTSSVTTFVGP